MTLPRTGHPSWSGLALAALLLALAALLLALAAGCGERREGIVELDLAGSLEDMESPGLGGGSGLTMRSALQLLLDASRDDEVSGVLVRFGPLETGPARAEELRDALRRLRDAGRAVHCQIEEGGNFAYWLAAGGCERIALSPGGSLDLTGLAAESIYIRELLASVGLEADVLVMGTHKGAAEFLTHDEMTPEIRETLEGVLDDLTELLVEGIAEGRRLEPGAVREILDGAPYSADEALALGLVDAVEHRDEALEALEAALPGDPRVLDDWAEQRLGGGGGLLQALAGDPAAGARSGERVAVLYLSGPVVRGGGGLLGSQIALDRVREALEEIREDEQIRAIVVRVESPGGSALVSDEIYHDLLEIRAERPVVASMGNVAASGGYYIAAAATEVLAGRGTLTGSIGVVGGKLVAGELMERVGATPITIARGRNAGLESLARPFSESERAALSRVMAAVYERFIASVVEGRVMDPEAVRTLATGQVWTGRRALELGLVDRLGGLHDAIALARELGGLAEDAPVQAFPRQPGLFEQLESTSLGAALWGGAPVGRELARAFPGAERAFETAALLREERVLALAPYAVTVR